MKGLRPISLYPVCIVAVVPTDLIYEGITTLIRRRTILTRRVPTDLIYEGITTASVSLAVVTARSRTDRPDL